MPKITIEHLSINYYKKKQLVETAIKDLSCVFESGKITVIIGPSGSGKTSLLKAILGIINYEGNIYFDDINVNAISLKEKNMAYIDQDVTLYPHYSIFQNIAFPLLNSGASVEECRKRSYDIAKKLKIENLLSRKPKQISLGQAQRVVLAKALVKRAYVYLFDEPFSSLDAEHRFSLRHDLKELLSELGATAIFVTHSIDEAFMMGDKIMVLDNGEMVEISSPDDLKESNNLITKELIEHGCD